MDFPCIGPRSQISECSTPGRAIIQRPRDLPILDRLEGCLRHLLPNIQRVPSGALKSYTGTPYFPLLVKITLPPLTNHLLILFVERMLIHISKKELGQMAKRIRATANMPKDSLTQKQKASATTTQAPIEQDEETTSGLVFKRKRKATTAPTEYSHSDGTSSFSTSCSFRRSGSAPKGDCYPRGRTGKL